MKGQKASPRFLGGAAVAAAYAAWGTLTIFWNLLADVNPVYILAQRLIWSMVFMGIYMAVTGKLKDIAPAFKDKRTFLLLPACGIVTSMPLLLFNIGVQKIPYYFSGILMYINPTLQFLMGLFYFREELDRNRLIAFILIWIGVLFTVYDKVKMIKSDRRRGNNVCA